MPLSFGIIHRCAAEKILASGKLTALVMVTITEAGRRAFATEDVSHRNRAAARSST